MSLVAVLGAGSGGRSAVVELTHAGHRVRLWNRNPETLAVIRASGAITHTGVLGDGEVRPELVTTSLAEALAGVDVAVVCLPALAHTALFADLCEIDPLPPIVLNPGQTGGALHARAVFADRGRLLPPVAELSTLTYVARVGRDGLVNVTSRARVVRCGCLPGHQDAQKWALELFPGADPVADVMASSLANVNLVLHAPGAVLSAAWMEATGGNYRFYVDAMTPGVARVLEALDAERLAVGRAYDHELAPLVAEMAAIGTADARAAADGDVVGAIRNSPANARINAPDSYAHRYYREDLGYSLAAFAAFADRAAVAIPTAHALLALGRTAADVPPGYGLDAASLGIDTLTFEQLCRVVRG
jgi:opine dehydrogenase